MSIFLSTKFRLAVAFSFMGALASMAVGVARNDAIGIPGIVFLLAGLIGLVLIGVAALKQRNGTRPAAGS